LDVLDSLILSKLNKVETQIQNNYHNSSRLHGNRGRGYIDPHLRRNFINSVHSNDGLLEEKEEHHNDHQHPHSPLNSNHVTPRYPQHRRKPIQNTPRRPAGFQVARSNSGRRI